MRDLRQALELIRSAFSAAWWTMETVWLGGQGILRAIILCVRYREIVAEERRCARGHAVAMYGLFDCRCGGRLEGWAFSRCAICGESAGWTPCLVCGLPLRNPLLT